MNQENFGKLIKEIRKKYNLTQKDLALKYNVTYQAVSKWENGKNMPDISLIRQISKDFNISMDNMLTGEFKEEKSSKIKYIIVGILVLIILLLIILLVINKSDDFKVKTIGSSCDNFKISGSISYNKNKSSIYLNNIKYCGEINNEKYKSINCILYEKNGKEIKEISNYMYNDDTTLQEFLDNAILFVDNYSIVCNNSLYLEIEATNKNDSITKYEIPLTINDSCNK